MKENYNANFSDTKIFEDIKLIKSNYYIDEILLNLFKNILNMEV